MAEKLKLKTETDGSFQDALNQTLDASGWLESPVVASCMLRQGKSPSMLGAITGAGLINVFKSRAAKEMPRSFVLVATADRVSAYKARGVSSDDDDAYTITIEPGEVAGWPRDHVTMRITEAGMTPNGVLIADGREIPVSVPASRVEAAFSALLSALA